MGADRYVSLSGSHTSPFDSWATAATNIQDAVDVAVAGETVLVADGRYTLTNQILIANAITLESQNNLGATIDGNGSVRCLRITGSGVTVDGFRIQNGYLSGSAYNETLYGANVYCSNDDSTIQNCIISGGTALTTRYAKARGGGAYNGTYVNCTFSNNIARYTGTGYGSNTEVKGGAVYSGILENCVVVNNSATRPNNFGPPTYGGGLFGGEATGCILQGNYARAGGGAYTSTLKNCLVVENETLSGAAGAGVLNSTIESCTVADNIGQGIYGGSATNCIIYGNTVTNWAGTVSMGYSCTTPDPGGTGNITQFSGFGNDYLPLLDSETVDAGLNEAWMTGDTDLRGAPRILDGTVDMGCYEQGVAHYVSPNGSAASPYATWTTAATDIQSAIDACSPWDMVIVTDSVYTVTQQLLIASNNVTVQSVNGPWNTTIAGDGSIRCIRITGSDVNIEGFRIQGGYLAGSSSAEFRGANVYCSDDSVTFQNCIITGGVIRVSIHARAYGAGAYNGTYINCDFVDNHALYYGSSWGATLTRGGAAYSCILENCYVAENTSKRASGAIGNPSTLAGGGLYAPFFS